MRNVDDDYFKFWGTRGSSAVSGDPYRHFGGNTSCLEIHSNGHYIIIDAGSGIRPLGLALRQKNVRKIDLFLSHTHWDHIIGLPFFEPLYSPGTQITVWSLPGEKRSCEQLFDQLFAAEFFPVGVEEIQSQVAFRTIDPQSSLKIGPIVMDFHPLNHPGKTCGFKFTFSNSNQTIGYVSDNELFEGFHGMPSQLTSQELEPYESLISFLSGCDTLVHEAQYFPEEYRLKIGWGHSSILNAVALICRVCPKQWLVTHHDPVHTDEDLFRMADLAQQLLQEHQSPCSVEWVPDGRLISY